jgi:hypothetical protein
MLTSALRVADLRDLTKNKPGLTRETGLARDSFQTANAVLFQADLPAADGESSAGGAGAGAAFVGAAHPGGQGAEAGAAQLGPFGEHAGAQAAAGAAQLGLAVQHLAAGAAHDGFIEQRLSFGMFSFGRQSFGRSSFGRQSFGSSSFGGHSFGSSSFGSLNPDGQPQSPAQAGAIWNDKAAAVSNAATERFIEVSPRVKVGT